MHDALLSSKSNAWCTPQDFFEKLDAQYHFTIDAAATRENAKCARYFTVVEDGLAQSWAGERVFCNPPYGREIGRWVRKAWEESERAELIVMLIPARTDTHYFHDYLLGRAELHFLRGRLRFTLEDGTCGPAPFPSMLAVYHRDANANTLKPI